MRGLLDAYYHTGNQKALDVVVKMANWAHLALTVGDKNHPDYTGPITRDNLNYMWDLYIAGESGGANEVFPEIYALTGDGKHLETARFFDNRESLFQACVENRDILVTTPQTRPGRRRPDRLHVNQHVPQFVGYMRVYEHSGDPEYFQAAKNFFKMVVPHRMYANGGTGGNFPGSNNNIEMFQNRDNIANSIAQGGAETCSAYNLGKLARNLFLHEHDPAYMDYYERGLINQIAGSRADTSSVSNPQVTYFQPLTPGASRSYGNTGTCCGGTGLENHTKYQDTIYFRSADGGTLWVNLFLASTLTWADKGFVVTQETNYPREDHTRLTVDGRGRLDIKLRVPGWVRRGFFVTVNGVAQDVDATPGSYLTLSRDWEPGDTIEVRMPFSIRIERAIDRPDTQAIFWGPTLLQILGNPGRAATANCPSTGTSSGTATTPARPSPTRAPRRPVTCSSPPTASPCGPTTSVTPSPSRRTSGGSSRPSCSGPSTRACRTASATTAFRTTTSPWRASRRPAPTARPSSTWCGTRRPSPPTARSSPPSPAPPRRSSRRSLHRRREGRRGLARRPGEQGTRPVGAPRSPPTVWRPTS